RGVDLRRNAPAVRPLPDELVTQDAPEAHVAAGELKVGIADTDRPYPQHGLAVNARRFRHVGPERDTGSGTHDTLHHRSRSPNTSGPGNPTNRYNRTRDTA